MLEGDAGARGVTSAGDRCAQQRGERARRSCRSRRPQAVVERARGGTTDVRAAAASIEVGRRQPSRARNRWSNLNGASADRASAPWSSTISHTMLTATVRPTGVCAGANRDCRTASSTRPRWRATRALGVARCQLGVQQLVVGDAPFAADDGRHVNMASSLGNACEHAPSSDRARHRDAAGSVAVHDTCRSSDRPARCCPASAGCASAPGLDSVSSIVASDSGRSRDVLCSTLNRHARQTSHGRSSRRAPATAGACR